MSLKEKVQQNLNKAVKEKEILASSALRMLSAAVLNKEKEKRYKISKEKPDLREEELVKESYLTDEEVLVVIASEAKKRKEAIEGFAKGGREDAANKERKELEILENYLPKQLLEEEIQKLVKEAIEKVGAKEIRDIGKVMSDLVPKIKGKADGSAVSKIVRDLLSS